MWDLWGVARATTHAWWARRPSKARAGTCASTDCQRATNPVIDPERLLCRESERRNRRHPGCHSRDSAQGRDRDGGRQRGRVVDRTAVVVECTSTPVPRWRWHPPRHFPTWYVVLFALQIAVPGPCRRTRARALRGASRDSRSGCCLSAEPWTHRRDGTLRRAGQDGAVPGAA